MNIALDSTYSVGADLSGVGVYSRELLSGLARAHPSERFTFCYRSHRFLRSFGERLPPNCHRFLLGEARAPRSADVFHGLNQRLPHARLRHAVTTFHDLFVLTGDYSTPDFRRRFAEQARDAASRSEHIIAVSQFTARQLMDLLGVEADRVHVVEHGVRPAAPLAVAREKIVLHVGAIQRRKNLVRLAEAFEKLDRDWQLVLAGSNGYGAEEILARISRSPSRERIRLPGYVSRRDLARWYARAMIFAFPSLDEGFGIPVLEAMAAGVPVLASNRAAIPEVAGDAAWLVNPEDSEELTEGLLSLAKDPGKCAELALKGLKRSVQFSWDAAIEKTWQVYRAMAAGVSGLV